MSHQDAKKKQEWSPEMEKIADEFVDFLKDPSNKLLLKNFVTETYKKREAEKIEALKARVEQEMDTQSHKLGTHHNPGNISPIMAEDFSMVDSERAFARGLRTTKKSMERSVEDRVEEINRLLSGIGGFSSQLKSCFARSTVVFLEQDDPKFNYRERLIFSIHLPNYELKRKWDVAADAAAPAAKTSIKTVKTMKASGKKKEEDPRTDLQATWDDAVNALAGIIESVGLKPKYCKNDRNFGRFVMKQELLGNGRLPDEFFALTLDYNTAEKIKEMCVSYNKILKAYEKKVKRLERRLVKYPASFKAAFVERLRKKYDDACQERDFFAATVPDPNQLDEGLLFLIEVSSLKDYYVVKNRMQSIMTKFILHLSKIAVREAHLDPDLEYEMWKTESKKKNDTQEMEEVDLEGVQEYVVDAVALEPAKKKAA